MVINPAFYPEIGYLALVNCTEIVVEGLNLTANGQGLLLAFTSNSTIINVNVSRNAYGIQLCSSNSINIVNCTIVENSENGITVDRSSNNNRVTGNTIYYSKIGVKTVHSCVNNTFSENIVKFNGKGLWIFSYSSGNIVERNVIADNNIGVAIQRFSPTMLVGNLILNNTEGVFAESQDNLIYHNNFVNNTVQVKTSNFTSRWDYGYCNGGNYWSDYEGEDENGDGIGDAPYIIDQFNLDRYPLLHQWSEKDEDPPFVGFPNVFPIKVQPYENVTVSVAVTDVGSGIKNVTLFYTIDNVSWTFVHMRLNYTVELYNVVLPGQPAGTVVEYKIVAFDNCDNMAVRDNGGKFFAYQVVPEFCSTVLLFLFLMLTVFLVFLGLKHGFSLGF